MNMTPKQRFRVGAERALAESYPDAMQEDVDGFVRHFFECVKDGGFSGRDYMDVAGGVAGTGTDAWSELHNHVHHAIEGVFWESYRKRAGADVTDLDLTQDFSDAADKVMEKLLDSTARATAFFPITAQDFDSIVSA